MSKFDTILNLVSNFGTIQNKLEERKRNRQQADR